MRDCYNCKRYETEGECIECHYEPKDEPQTCSVNGRPFSECGNCEYHKCTADEPQIIACPINERAEYWFYEDEPQSDGILFKGDLKEGDYKLIKTTDGWVLEGKDIVYCGWERGNE